MHKKNNETNDEIIEEASSRLADIFVDLIDSKEGDKKSDKNDTDKK